MEAALEVYIGTKAGYKQQRQFQLRAQGKGRLWVRNRERGDCQSGGGRRQQSRAFQERQSVLPHSPNRDVTTFGASSGVAMPPTQRRAQVGSPAHTFALSRSTDECRACFPFHRPVSERLRRESVHARMHLCNVHFFCGAGMGWEEMTMAAAGVALIPTFLCSFFQIA